jgi:hypothetical protein
MHFLRLFNRVWVSGRDGDYTIVSIDHPACVVDLCPPSGGTAIETNVPFSLLSESSPFDPAQSDLSIPDTLDSTSYVLDSTWQSLRTSYVALAELRDLVHDTTMIIQATQRRIVESDQLIARAGFGAYPNDGIVTTKAS